MTLERATQEAERVAGSTGKTICVYNAPIENAEDPEGPFGFCPPEAFRILFRFGELVRTITPKLNKETGLREIVVTTHGKPA